MSMPRLPTTTLSVEHREVECLPTHHTHHNPLCMSTFANDEKVLAVGQHREIMLWREDGPGDEPPLSSYSSPDNCLMMLWSMRHVLDMTSGDGYFTTIATCPPEKENDLLHQALHSLGFRKNIAYEQQVLAEITPDLRDSLREMLKPVSCMEKLGEHLPKFPWE